MPPVDFCQPHGQIGPFRIQPARLFKGSRGVGPLSRRETGISVRKGLEGAGLQGSLRRWLWPDQRAPVGQWFHTNQPAPAMTTTIQIMLIMGLLSSAGV